VNSPGSVNDIALTAGHCVSDGRGTYTIDNGNYGGLTTDSIICCAYDRSKGEGSCPTTASYKIISTKLYTSYHNGARASHDLAIISADNPWKYPGKWNVNNWDPDSGGEGPGVLHHGLLLLLQAHQQTRLYCSSVARLKSTQSAQYMLYHVSGELLQSVSWQLVSCTHVSWQLLSCAHVPWQLLSCAQVCRAVPALHRYRCCNLQCGTLPATTQPASQAALHAQANL
jgi:hypothetical protein